MDEYRERYDTLYRSHVKVLNHLEDALRDAAVLRGAARDFLEAYGAHDDVSHEHLRCEMADTIPAPDWPERHTAACKRLAAAEAALRAAIGRGGATPHGDAVGMPELPHADADGGGREAAVPLTGQKDIPDDIADIIDAAWQVPPGAHGRIRARFLALLAEEEPDHPWIVAAQQKTTPHFLIDAKTGREEHTA